MHVVGVYEAQESVLGAKWSSGHRHGKVHVQVARQHAPITLVLCAYEPTMWDLDVTEGVDIRKIVLSGYYEQKLVGYTGTAEVLRQSYEQGSYSYFHTYGPSAEGHDMTIMSIKLLTRCENVAFQGAYSRSRFAVQ